MTHTRTRCEAADGDAGVGTGVGSVVQVHNLFCRCKLTTGGAGSQPVFMQAVARVFSKFLYFVAPRSTD